MKPLLIQQTQSTLGVDFDPAQGLLTLRGESYPEDALKFFTPVIHWLAAYLVDLGNGDAVNVDMDIVYFNSSSSKALMNIFETLEDAAVRGVEVNITWHCHKENEVARECGEEFREDLCQAKFFMALYEDGP